MAIVFDLILLGIFVFLAVRGCVKGFVRTVLGVGRLLLSLLLTVLCGAAFGRWLSDTLEWPFSAVLGYVILFVLLYVGCTLLMALVGRLVELPVIKQCDKLLGFLLGGLQGWLAVSLVAVVLYAVVYIGGRMDVYEASTIFQFLHKMNIFKFLIEYMV